MSDFPTLNGWFKEIYSKKRRRQVYGRLISSSKFKGRNRYIYVNSTSKEKVVMKFHGEGRYASVSIEINEQVLNELFDTLVSVKSFIGGNKEALK